MQETEFTALIQSHLPLLHKVSQAYCRNEEDRRDVVQEIVVALWRSRDQYDPRGKASTWMYRVALNVAISFYRRERKHHEARESDAAIEIIDAARSEPGADVERLQRCMARLDELNRALVLLWLDGHEYVEIADLLGITKTNVATKLQRIKQQLRRCIEAHPVEP